MSGGDVIMFFLNKETGLLSIRHVFTPQLLSTQVHEEYMSSQTYDCQEPPPQKKIQTRRCKTIYSSTMIGGRRHLKSVDLHLEESFVSKYVYTWGNLVMYKKYGKECTARKILNK
jgi:hypothetical protein